MSEPQELPRVEYPPVTRLSLVKYAAASGDFNPIHWDESVASEVGLDGVIAHGMLSMGLLGEYVASVAGGEYTRRLSARFRAMVRLGDVLVCRGTIRSEANEVRRIDVRVETRDGRVVVTGEAEVVMGHPDRAPRR
ncbi:MaoC/PaaZ C-terminal domain-containing protein [Streptomyces plumbiresistens]|uniref:MaoC family dehydratase n=1 Tax=Streptomyces plumbiresistens TaxID=511811 RepID=A0ABP7SKK7_9ACTN